MTATYKAAIAARNAICWCFTLSHDNKRETYITKLGQLESTN